MKSPFRRAGRTPHHPRFRRRVIENVSHSEPAAAPQLTHSGERGVNAGELCNHLHRMWTEGGVECRHFSGHLETEKRERGVANEGQKGTRGQVPGERAKGGERGGRRRKKCRLVYIKMSLGRGGVVSISVRSSVWSASLLASTAPSFPLLSKPLNSP